MTEFEKAKHKRDQLLERFASIGTYNWDDEYKAKVTYECFKGCDDIIDPTNFTKEQMDVLRFGKWSKDNPVRLIPLWMFYFLPNDIKTISIFGEKINNKASMDTDHRFGCLAYGVIPRKKSLKEKIMSWLKH